MARPSLVATEQAALGRLVQLGLPVYCGGSRRRAVALTFDDGPGPYSRLAVRILRRAGARATFFLVGRKLAYFPEIPRLERSLAVLADHTWTHPNLLLLGKSAVASELSRTKAAIARTAGTEVELFRPPYGLSDAAITATARSLGMAEIRWSIDSRDSEGADWSQIAAIVSRSVRPGSIILMHENRGQTLRALRFRILPELGRRHFELVSVPELMATDPPPLAQLRAGIGGCSAGSTGLSSR